MTHILTGKIASEDADGLADLQVIVQYVDDPNAFDIDGTGNSGQWGVPTELSAGALSGLDQFPGEHLGSTITEEGGAFELSYEFDETIGPNDARLVVYVLSPETSSKGAYALPIGSSPSDRLLHVSILPVGESDTIRQVDVRVPDQRLIEAGYPTTTVVRPPPITDDPKAAATAFVTSIQERDAFFDHVKTGFSGEFEAQITRHTDLVEEIRDRARHITAARPALRTSSYFVPESASEEQVEVATTAAKEYGFTKLRAYQQTVEPRRPLAKFIPNDWFTSFEYDPPEIGEPFEISERQFCSLLKPEGSGYDLSRVRGLLDTVGEDRPTTEPPATPTDSEEPSSQSPEETLKQLVYEQLESLSAPALKPIGDGRDPLLRIESVVSELHHRSGPTNVTSFQDFHTLQIAFKDVWTEAFDPTVVDLLEEVGVEQEVLHSEHGQSGTPLPVEFAEMADITAFLRDVENRSDSLLQPVPPEITRVWGMMADGKGWNLYDRWNLLSPNEKVALRMLAEGAPTALQDDAAVTECWERALYDFTGEDLRDLAPQIPLFGGLSIPAMDELAVRIATWVKASVQFGPQYRPMPPAWWRQVIASFDGGDLLSIIKEVVQNHYDVHRFEGEPEEFNDFAVFVRQQITAVLERECKAASRAMTSTGGWSSGTPVLFGVDVSTLSINERVAMGTNLLSNPSGARTRLTRLLTEIRERLSTRHSFEYFEPNSVNYGILTTYRQEWKPGLYQVGDLVSTIPLAPGETRKFTKRESIKRSRATKELENALSAHRGESAMTKRAETEIVQKANQTTNFKMAAQGSLNFGIGSASAATEFALNQARESAATKKDFREAILKAAQEYKHERSLEVTTSDELTGETTSSGDLSNPNNEITVTYLLYELERQYQISEQIHRLTPVILVAQDVPSPHEITEAWLLQHEWVLRRVLLDDRFESALDHLSGPFAGDELSLEVKRENWETQKDLVEKLEASLGRHLERRDSLRSLLTETTEERDLAAAGERSTGQEVFSAIVTGGFSLLADDPAEEYKERLEARRKVLETQLGYLEETIQNLQDRLAHGADTYNQATNAYTSALEERTGHRLAIDQLRVHVKDNILYYMQAIWDHEPSDQRFFRLYNKEVYVPRSANVTFTLQPFVTSPRTAKQALLNKTKRFKEVDGRWYIVKSESEPVLDNSPENLAQLVEVADIDEPLGYKGNYVIFPLRTCTYVTDYMMREFVDDYLGLADPDELGDFTAEQLVALVKKVRRDLTPEERAMVDDLIARRLASPRRESDLVVVPTGELYMEALLGEQALLEPFKLAHRGYDAAKARAELREAELENLRHAARLLEEEPNLDDPDADRYIVVEGIDAETEIEINDGENSPSP